jgi:Sec-independent protein translocase protein TatA
VAINEAVELAKQYGSDSAPRFINGVLGALADHQHEIQQVIQKSVKCGNHHMEILGIGAPELIFILIIAIIVLGPKDMQKAGRTIGRWLNQLIRSDSWKVFQRTSAELRNLPRNLMREANMEMAEMERDLRNAIDPRSDPASIQTPKVDPPTVKPIETNSDKND